jgi:DNA-binding MarR family transcriptional regulator
VADEDLVNAARVIARLARLLEVKPTRLTMGQYRLLAMAAHVDVDRSTGFAWGLSVTRPAVSGMIDGLVAQGLLRRRQHQTDGRALKIEVTDAGRDAPRATEEMLGSQLPPLLSEPSDPLQLFTLLRGMERARDTARRQRVGAASTQHHSGRGSRIPRFHVSANRDQRV